MPRLVGERRSHARPLGEPLDGHVVGERHFRRLDHAGDRRRGTKVRRRRQRDVALAAQQPRRRIESDPAGAGEIHFGPGVQIGEIEIAAGGSVERFQVRPQLNEIAGHEARRQSDVAEDLHQEPRRIAARAGAGGERLLRRLHARLHADDVADHVRQALVELDQKIDGVARLARNRLHQFLQPRARRLRIDEGRQILAQVGGEFERPLVGVGLDEKVERIDHFHVGEQIDRDGKFGCLLGKHEARQPIAVRVLLPVHEMLGRRHVERVTRDAGAAMRRRPQPYDLRAEADRPVIGVVRCVMEADEDRHAVTRYAWICPIIMQ